MSRNGEGISRERNEPCYLEVSHLRYSLPSVSCPLLYSGAHETFSVAHGKYQIKYQTVIILNTIANLILDGQYRTYLTSCSVLFMKNPTLVGTHIVWFIDLGLYPMHCKQNSACAIGLPFPSLSSMPPKSTLESPPTQSWFWGHAENCREEEGKVLFWKWTTLH